MSRKASPLQKKSLKNEKVCWRRHPSLAEWYAGVTLLLVLLLLGLLPPVAVLLFALTRD